MILSITVLIPLILVAQAPAKEMIGNRNGKVQGSRDEFANNEKLVSRAHKTMDNLANKLVDKLVDKMIEFVLKVSPLHRENLDQTTLSNLAMNTRPGVMHVPPMQGKVAAHTRPTTGQAAFTQTPLAHSSLAQNRRNILVRGSNNPVIMNPGEYPDPPFMKEVESSFPDAGIADHFQARALMALGYTWLDVRTPLEFEEGSVTGAVNIPIITGSRRFDSESNTRLFKEENQQANTEFVKQVEKMFPDKKAKLLIACSDARQRAIMALELLDAAGYTHIVGVKGGYMKFHTIYDAKLNRRRGDGFIEDWAGQGSDAAGIHGSGAGIGMWEAAGGFSGDPMPMKDINKWIKVG